MIKQIKYFLKQERGSFTLESAVIFPLLLALILSFIVLGMYLYQQAVLYYSASVIAERTAFCWDNSHRDMRSGILPEAKYDGLYRRLGSDGMLISLFGLKDDGAAAAMDLPVETTDDDSEQGLSHRKLSRSAKWLFDAGLSYEGRISHLRGALKQSVEVMIRQPLEFIPFELSGQRREATTVSAAAIVDPVEFIRSVDLVRYYTAKFTNSGQEASSKTKARQVLTPYQAKRADKEG